LPCADRLTPTFDNLYNDSQNGKPISLAEESIVDTDTASRIVLILESPHTKEYEHVTNDSTGNIIGTAEPARGDTGININKYFVPLIEKLKLDDWRIGLLNPIQYSCSFGGSLSTKSKNRIFNKLMQQKEFRLSFKKRLQIMCGNEHILLNCCTYRNNEIIDELLTDFGFNTYVRMSHPSSPKFIQQCARDSRKREPVQVYLKGESHGKQVIDEALWTVINETKGR
jgi:hypothetical protein